MPEVEWRHSHGRDVEGSPSWEADVNGTTLKIRRSVTGKGYEYWFIAMHPGFHSSLWDADMDGARTWLSLEAAQAAAISFARRPRVTGHFDHG